MILDIHREISKEVPPKKNDIDSKEIHKAMTVLIWNELNDWLGNWKRDYSVTQLQIEYLE